MNQFKFLHVIQAAYDKAQKAKKAAEARHKELDSKRKKFKEGKFYYIAFSLEILRDAIKIFLQ